MEKKVAEKISAIACSSGIPRVFGDQFKVFEETSGKTHLLHLTMI